MNRRTRQGAITAKRRRLVERFPSMATDRTAKPGQHQFMSVIFIETGLTVLAVVFGAALLGILVGRLLPEHHLSSETKAAVSLSMAMLG
jgi:heme/copper-type cytochrome/quinol oxidase subunit 3